MLMNKSLNKVERTVIGLYLEGREEGKGVLGIGTITPSSSVGPIEAVCQIWRTRGNKRGMEISGAVVKRLLVIPSKPGVLLARDLKISERSLVVGVGRVGIQGEERKRETVVVMMGSIERSQDEELTAEPLKRFL